MSRKDYDEIKEKFGAFIATWKNRNIKVLDNIIDQQIKCYMSIVGHYNDGSQHTISGVKGFVLDFPQSDYFHTRICNYNCRCLDGKAQQIAHIVCTAANKSEESEELDTFQFVVMFSNEWKRSDKSWKMTELRMDVLKEKGMLASFENEWFFEKPVNKFFPGMHFSCIQGEMDSPWTKVPVCEDILTEEEKIIDVFCKYNYGVDNCCFNYVCDVLHEDFMADIQPWGSANKRRFIQSLKFGRERDVYPWMHPFKAKSIKINGDEADVELYRTAGHRQRKHSIVFTKETIDQEYACARHSLKLKKVEGEWKIVVWNYFLGILDMGKYEDDLYGEKKLENKVKK